MQGPRTIHRFTRVLALAGLLLGASATATADHDSPVAPDVAPKISAILSPLGSQPAIVTDGEDLRVELSPEVLGADATGDILARLVPSFGAARAPVDLALSAASLSVPSALWPGRTVHAYTFAMPTFGEGFVEDLYDLEVSFGLRGDVQHRAVKVLDEYPDDFTFVIIADPSVGDPRPIQEGAEDLRDSNGQNSTSLSDKTVKTAGNPMDGGRWGALVRTIQEVNLLQPDFVLVAGDLTFALYPRAANVEYEDAYKILNTLQVPSFLTPGNHDLYNFEYDGTDRPHLTDGKELWNLYFGPWYWSTDAGPDMHIVGLNTFDWSDKERQPINEQNGSTRSGGQVSDEQLAWLEADLAAYRARNSDGAIVTVAHHDPSWLPRRHPWPGDNRIAMRQALDTHDVFVHFAGHTHEDRVARYHGGNIVETNGRLDYPLQQLHYIRNDALDPSWSQGALGAIIRDPSHGPLYVTTTTAASGVKGPDWGLGSYWGYRYGVFDAKPGGGYDPADFGYLADADTSVVRAFLDGHAERPEVWNAAHAALGVHSYPSYFLSRAFHGPNDGREQTSGVTLTNDLLEPVTVEVVLSVAGAGASVSGGAVVWTRTHHVPEAGDGSLPVARMVTDVKVRVALGVAASVSVTATAT